MKPLDWILHPRQSASRLRRLLRRNRKHVRVWLRLFLLLALVAVASISTVVFWDWLSNDVWNWLGTAPNGEVRQETNSTTLRNIGLVVAGLIALPLAVWRSIVAQRQAEIAQRDLLNERYQQGAEMLGNDVLSVRLGGIYALQSLAEEHAGQYHIQIMRLFCAFARHPTKDNEVAPDVEGAVSNENPSLQEEVQAVMQAISACRRTRIALELEAGFRLDLRRADLKGMKLSRANLYWAHLEGANLSHADIIDANLSTAWLMDANLSSTILVQANLTEAWLMSANLSHSSLRAANLSGATSLLGANLYKTDLAGADLSFANVSTANLSYTNLEGANLSGTYLENVENLTQVQLDEARADPKNPPNLAGLVDAETGMPLVWRGKPLDDEA